MNEILRTERLLLREMTWEDLPDLAQMLQDPLVMYAYEHEFTDEDVKQWLSRQLDRYEKYGFGLWAAVLKGSGRMVGQTGLTYQKCEGAQVLEVGYLLKRKFWHQGYAREAAAGCRDYAFQVLGAHRVHSVIKTDNAASIRVAESLGMHREKEFVARYYNGDMPHYLYMVSKEESLPGDRV